GRTTRRRGDGRRGVGLGELMVRVLETDGRTNGGRLIRRCVRRVIPAQHSGTGCALTTRTWCGSAHAPRSFARAPGIEPVKRDNAVFGPVNQFPAWIWDQAARQAA